MEILNINALNYDKKFIDPLLKKGLSDDYLFDRVFIELSIKKTTADIVNWFYRLLWESCYIKSTMPSNIHQPKNGELNIEQCLRNLHNIRIVHFYFHYL